MKKLTLGIMTALMLLSILPAQAAIENRPVSNVTVPAAVPAEITVLLNRLDEIKAMDMSSLAKSEKKELRKEVRGIKSELRAASQGVYLSVGAILIIILLLILLL